MRHRYCRVPAQACGLVTRASCLCHAGKAAAHLSLRRAALALLAALMLHGCAPGPTHVVEQTIAGEQRIVVPRAIEVQRALALLSQLDPSGVFISPQGNALVLVGPADQLARMETVLDLIDSPEPYVIETIAPVSAARAVPTNRQSEGLLGDVDIGTFTNPPVSTGRPGAIIDIHGPFLVAIVPARLHSALLAVVRSGPADLRPGADMRDRDLPATVDIARDDRPLESPPAASGSLAQAEPVAASDEPLQSPPAATLRLTENRAESVPQRTMEILAADCPECSTRQPASPPASGELLASESIADLYLAPDPCDAPEARYALPPLANGEDLLQLDLAETVELIELLDLAAEYLHLDYLCDPEVLAGQTVSLRLHGKLRGEIRVKELYPLLESVLKFKGYAMTCHRDNLVTIVPVGKVLEADPELLDAGQGTVRPGGTVVTRLFALQYVNTTTAGTLLDQMKLSVAVSPIEETQTLVVTGYAHRMARIEQLLGLVDRPGRPKEFRFRQLKYALAGAIIGKIETLATELQMAPIRGVAAAPARRSPMPSPLERAGGPRNPEPFPGRAVYLDADERTNRILMVGFSEELAMIEDAIDAFDLPRQDPRVPKVYRIRRLDAADVLTKLEELEVIGVWLPVAPSNPRIPGTVSAAVQSAQVDTANLAEQPQVTLIESTNVLLINATEEQHVWIATLIDHIDVAPEDPRVLWVYDIEHVDAGEVRKKLQQFEGIVAASGAPGLRGSPRGMAASKTVGGPGTQPTDGLVQAAGSQSALLQPQVIVLETTNSLLVHATEEQQQWIGDIIRRIDVEVRQEAIPYEIYFLENQEPERLAEILQRIIQETIRDKEGKVERVVRSTDDEIMVVPDAGTFSLIVYANRKNQDWISKLIRSLDKRRPQVLIDVTLVEITKTEAFTYDLNWIQSFPDLTPTSGLTGALVPSPGGGPAVSLPGDISSTLAQSGRSSLTDLQSDSGSFRGFYGDEHINVLLQAMASKNYGRVLAKPKVLVNDNEPGSIKTADITYVEVRSSIPVGTGGAGNDVTLIETARKFESYEAGIDLRITPHISEGDLLRLKIELSRSDFLQAGSLERPPDTRANELATAVTVPDGSTIILGGLLKLNQHKSGRKVPLLGDIPFVGGLFRGIDNRDNQSSLYIFVKAEIIRPAGLLAQRMRTWRPSPTHPRGLRAPRAGIPKVPDLARPQAPPGLPAPSPRRPLTSLVMTIQILQDCSGVSRIDPVRRRP